MGLFKFTGAGLRIASFNCKNVKTSIDEIYDLCSNNDIVLLQETWLLDTELSFLQSVHNDFFAKSISSVDTSCQLLNGRPHGGISILWRKELTKYCVVKDYDDCRILGLEFKCAQAPVLLLNIYLPFCSDNNKLLYESYLSRIGSIIDSYPSPYIYIIGDFNADIKMSHGIIKQSFGKLLTQFCEDENLVIADQCFLSSDTFTFYSNAHDSESWLDHIVTTKSGYNLISNMKVENSYISSDHFPLFMSLDIENLPCQSTSTHFMEGYARVKWDEATGDTREQYRKCTARLLSSVPLDHDSLMCSDPQCDNTAHREAIDLMYHAITDSLVHATKETFAPKRKKPACHIVPGWNDFVKASHDEARGAFKMWISHNKPKQGYVFYLMKSTRARFKYSLRFCKSQETQARADALAKRLLMKDDRTFWKEIKAINKGDTDILSNTIEDATGDVQIAEMWQNHYSELLNSNNDTSDLQFVLKKINKATDVNNVKVSVTEVFDAIKNLKCNKSPGKDTLQSEHFKYADPILQCLLTMCINCMLVHSYLPDKAMASIIIPLVKDKKGLLSSKNNYRPVAITSVFSKVLESIVLVRYQHLLSSADNQFGFKSKHGTDLCVFSLKQIIEFYHGLSSPVYVCFLDAAKAFDRLNHWSLFRKLIDCGIPILFVKLFVFWYRHQLFYVKWGSIYSSHFTSINGIRQGGIISPLLFNLYMNGLSKKLNESQIGCNINGKFVNHLLYADDSCLIAPSPAALQKLLDICDYYAQENTILYNESKTKCMAFMPKCLRKLDIPNMYLNGSSLKFVSSIKYLGMTVNDNLLDDQDLKRHQKYLYIKGNLLTSKFRSCTTEVKCKLFRTYCYSAYGGHLWTSYTTRQYNKVRVAFNDVFRNLFNVRRGESISGYLVNYRLDSFSCLIRKAQFNFRKRLLESSNSIIKCICASVYFMCHSDMVSLWDRSLYTF